MADTSQVKEITAKLEQGVKDLFTSDRYADYLKTMSRFHKYSTRNTLLIHMQKPDATLVAGFRSWQTKFGRSVRRGEKSIKILAPVPFVTREEKEKLDPSTRLPIIGDDGLPVVEYTERHLARFKVTSVFDVSQTAGKPLPSLAQDLTGDVEQYNAFMDTLREVSPIPIIFEDMQENQDGVCRFGHEIAIRAGMSQSQTVSATIHEIVHAKLHDKSLIVKADGDEPPKDRRREEVEAESVSFSVAAYFGIETGANSFGYIAEWSRTQELKELNTSLDTIRKTATELITDIEAKFHEIVKERDITLAIGEAQDVLSIPMAAKQLPSITQEIDREAIVKRILDYILKSDPEHPKKDLAYIEKNMRTKSIEDLVEFDFAFYFPGESPPLLQQQVTQVTKANIESKQKRSTALAESKLYEKFAELFPKVSIGENSYLRLEAGDAFMPLSLEWISSDQISVMHTYTLNGDLCYDPMIVFKVGYTGKGDNETKTLSAVEYQQSIPPLYQVEDADGRWISVDGNGNEKAIFGLQKSINEFAEQWFENIGNQGYMPVKAHVEIDGNTVEMIFDTDGNPIIPKHVKEYDIGYGFLGNGITVWNHAEEKDGDYVTIAHISNERDITFYDTDIPDNIKESIEDVAQSLDKGELDYKQQSGSDPAEPEQILPDPSINDSEMNVYGYFGDSMYPLTQSRATELYDADHTIYLLYPDNTEAMIFDRNEIASHDGIFGIERTEWEASVEYAEMKAETKNREGSREMDLLTAKENSFGIYQIKDRADMRDFRFASLEEIQSRGLDVMRNNYELVYTAPFSERIEFLTDRYPVLNNIYAKFNIEHPEGYSGRSVSVSDVIVLKSNNCLSSHYVDSIGFVEIDAFLGEEKAQLPERTAKEVENTKPSTYSQVGNRSESFYPAITKSKPTLAERLADNKLKAARQGQVDQHKLPMREVGV